MHKVQDVPLVLDEVEQGTIKEFVEIIGGVMPERSRRMADGSLVIPISLSGTIPSLPIALFMNHKTDQLYKQTSCRVRLAQCPIADKKKGMYLWGESDWEVLL